MRVARTLPTSLRAVGSSLSVDGVRASFSSCSRSSSIADAKENMGRNAGSRESRGLGIEDRSLEVPESRGLPLVGTLLSFVASGGAKKLHEYVDGRHAELGPIFRERIGPVEMIFVSSPDEYRRIFRIEGKHPRHFLPEAWHLYNEIRACRRGLLFMDGEEWSHFRKILNKLMLTRDPLRLMTSPCQEAAESLVGRWRLFVGDGRHVPDLETELYQWSIEAMLGTLIGSPWPQYKEQISRDVEMLATTLHKIFEYSASLSMMSAKLSMRLKLPSWRNFARSVDTALRIVHKLVPEIAHLDGDGLLKAMMDEGIRDEDLVRIVTDFILAAGDTTAFSTQWAILELAKHPDLQDELCENIRKLPLKHLHREPLLTGVIKETMRLYPTAPFIARYLPEDSIIGGYRVREGEMLVLSIYSSSRDFRNFPDADKFQPRRWIRTPEGKYKAVINPHASLPFAMGARSCIGRKLAEIQLALGLAELVRTFKIECTNSDRVKLILHLISVPSEPIRLKLTKRPS